MKNHEFIARSPACFWKRSIRFTGIFPILEKQLEASTSLRAGSFILFSTRTVLYKRQLETAIRLFKFNFEVDSLKIVLCLKKSSKSNFSATVTAGDPAEWIISLLTVPSFSIWSEFKYRPSRPISRILAHVRVYYVVYSGSFFFFFFFFFCSVDLLRLSIFYTRS